MGFWLASAVPKQEYIDRAPDGATHGVWPHRFHDAQQDALQ
jgi:hypothetical protein